MGWIGSAVTGGSCAADNGLSVGLSRITTGLGFFGAFVRARFSEGGVEVNVGGGSPHE
jgi:hypothetical protein